MACITADVVYFQLTWPSFFLHWGSGDLHSSNMRLLGGHIVWTAAIHHDHLRCKKSLYHQHTLMCHRVPYHMNHMRQQMLRYSPKNRQVTNIEPIRVRFVLTALKYICLHIIVDDSDDNRSKCLSLAVIEAGVTYLWDQAQLSESLRRQFGKCYHCWQKKLLTVYQVTSYKLNFTLLA